ncbi:hypothetical protein MLD38_006121 [Melastoma candidum]|uniref:Uncharacterized protein n=1 Tax=Melastoma candidum TaxID=119954 RepID=A0ACB9RMG3_9MYRT|nr:hypothetical protein MLD38_006121 [Melastoma candidum]
MEPEMSIETMAMIRVAVLPIGEIPTQLLRDYTSMILSNHTVSLSSVSSFYTEHQKSPFSHQPWDSPSGSLRFKFLLGGTPPSPWEDFQSNRKVLAVFGFCHCPSSPDLDDVTRQFGAACRSYSSALVHRCFAFCPSDSQLEDGSREDPNLKLFPPADRQTLEFHLQTMMQDVAACLLMEFEKWVLLAESSGTILKTPLDPQTNFSSEEVIKAKKRRLGRAQKTIGDYCLLAGSPVDANAHYSTALELARLTADYFWYAGALEGSVCALLLDRMGHIDPDLVDEVKYRYNSVIIHYRKSAMQDNVQRVSPLTFELEATLKLGRFLCRREITKDVVELLTNAADGAKSLIDASDRLILFVEIARLYGKIGYHRKAAFFSRQVAQLYLQQENRLAAVSAMQVLAMTTKAYRIQSKASSTQHAWDDDNVPGHANSKVLHQSIVSLFECQWSMLQMVVLREILLSAARAGDPLTAWSAAARLLRSYYPLITPAGQNGLANALANSAERLPSGTRCADPALPFIRLYSFPLLSSQSDIVKRNRGREDWWMGSVSSGPFIYTPFSKGDANDNNKQELVWIVGEPIQVLVELANPCGFDLRVDSIYLSVHSGNLDAFPVSVNLPPNSSKVVSLSGIPTSVGQVRIPGCTVHCFGVITEHLFRDVENLLLGAAQGLVLSDPFRCCGSAKMKNVHVPTISVVQPLPLLVPHIIGGDGSIILYEEEICDVWISLSNAGTVPVDQAHISLSGKNQDSVISISDDALQSCLPLKPGAEVTIRVTLKAWQVGSVDPDISTKSAFGSMGRHHKDASGPLLAVHYAGPLATSEDPTDASVAVPPGRRLLVPLPICVLPGLSLVKARLLSMEIPAHISEKNPLPGSKESPSSAEALGSSFRMEKFVKMDPFRGSWGLRFLELELSNPTDVVFEISVSVQLDNPMGDGNQVLDQDGLAEFSYPKTRIDRDYASRVLIPLEHFKLPVLDESFLLRDNQTDGAMTSGRSSSFSEKNAKAELNASIEKLISKIKVKWQSGRNSSGEMNTKDPIMKALQTSVMDVLLPDPLTFGLRLVKDVLGKDGDMSVTTASDMPAEASLGNGSVLANDITPIEVLVRNNTKEVIRLCLSISCVDVTGENCIEGSNSTVLWSGVLNRIAMEAPPLQETSHSFSLHFLVPGEYTLVATSVIENASDILRAHARTVSHDEPIFCRGPPFHLRVMGTV